MNHKKYEQIAYDEAKASKCFERQVGAILVNDRGAVIGQGYNYSDTCACNVTSPNTEVHCPTDVVHAEVACLHNANATYNIIDRSKTRTMYVTQPPCNKCIEKIKQFDKSDSGTTTIHVCEQFLKFDDDKVRFDLIPPEWEEYDAKVLTYGAKKYKEENWRKGEIARYIGACKRHWNAYRSGEWNDTETGLPHLAHLRTNIGFLISIHEGNNSSVADMIEQLNEVLK